MKPEATAPEATSSEPSSPETCEFALIGSGFSGIGMAIALRRAGLDDVLLLERGPALGGTWRDNIYPGCGCDVPSHLYSLSGEPTPEWSRVYARQPEIRAYLEGIAGRHDLHRRCRFDCDITEARFDEAEARWHLRAADGRRFVARFVIFGIGGLKDPRYPAIPGIESFEGISLHSARWDPTVDLRGKRVGLVGTGASAIQLGPALAPEAGRTVIFQRTPPWVIPRRDRAYGPLARALYRLPGVLWLERTLLYYFWELRHPLVFAKPGLIGRIYERLLRRHIRRSVDDPALAARVTPDYRAGCKRVLLSDDWYATLNRPDVDLIDTPIEAIEPHGIRLTDGTTIELDAIAWCTGFTVDRPMGDMKVHGLGGRELGEFWDGRPRAHLGITVPGFPNAFILLGPNTALGHSSVLVMIEAQIGYVMDAIRHLRGRPHLRWLDVRPDALDAFTAEVDAAHADTVWSSGCSSWYIDDEGHNFTLWPGTTLAYRWRTRRFDPTLHTFGEATSGAGPEAGG